ncbi:hypothetical protein [Duganella sp. Root1480D1]|uniref:hypothetical protein n=1 Tax=Duganella sp. Root1480D1 TaxID=1736471 RepID=UPI00071405BD|nr:hypothetical protein [Duganella sp. Root1480D1]KQZ31267.1 hypothetical protein ASD58_30055 [Duganella sp. Root1480D1]
MRISALLSATLAFSFISADVLADSNEFISPTLGLKLTKPSAWHFVSANTYLEQMKQVKWDEPGVQEHWNQALRAPVVVISQFPANHNGINPSFKIDAKPYGVIPSGISGKEVIAKLIPLMQQRFKKFRIDTAPAEVTLGSQQAGYAKMTYVSTSTTGVDFEITSQIWSVPMKSYLFILGATYAPNSKASEAEVKKIAQSISIE